MSAKRRASRFIVPVYRGWNRLRNGSRTVGAVIIVMTSDGYVLLVRNSYQSGWGLPGGFLQRREDVKRCAERELFEETGLLLSLDAKNSVAHVERSANNVTFVFVYESDRASASLKLRRPTKLLGRIEILGRDWFHLSNLPQLKRGTKDLFSAAGFHQYPAIQDLR